MVPPFAPLPNGAAIIAVPATKVELGLTIAGDIQSFEAQRAGLTAGLRTRLACVEPDCYLRLTVSTAGSVNVNVLMVIPSAPGAEATNVASAVEAAAMALVGEPIADLSSSLGVDVQAVDGTVSTAVGESVPIAVAPPPPRSPPLPVAPPVPPLEPPAPSFPAQTRSELAGGSLGGATIAAIGGGGAAALALALLVCFLCRRGCRQSHTQKRAIQEADGVRYRGSTAPPPPPNLEAASAKSDGGEYL